MHSCHGISTSTVWHIIHRVVPAILSLRRKFIRWPYKPLSITAKFRDTAGIHCVAGCVEGTNALWTHLIMMKTPTSTAIIPNLWIPPWQQAQITPSTSVAVVALKGGTIHEWLKKALCEPPFEQKGHSPFPEAVIQGDSAYACNKWLIPPF